MATEDALVIIETLLNALLGLVADHTICIPKEVTAKVKRNSTCALELKLVFLFKNIHKCLRVATDDVEVINVHSYVFVVVAFGSHPDIRFCLGWLKTHGAKDVSETFMPTETAGLETA